MKDIILGKNRLKRAGAGPGGEPGNSPGAGSNLRPGDFPSQHQNRRPDDSPGARLKGWTRALIRDRLFLCALAGNFILGALGLLVAPAVYGASRLRMDLQRPLLAILMIAAIIAALLFLSAMGYFANRTRKSGFIKDFPAHLKSSAQFAAFFICASILYAILCGLFAMTAHALLKNAVQYETIKLIVNIVTYIATLLLSPVMLMEMLSFTMSGLAVKDTVRAGLAGARLGYGRLLLLSAALLFAGGLIAMTTGHMQSAVMQGVPIPSAVMQSALLIVYTLIGGTGTYAIYRSGMEIYKRAPGKAQRKSAAGSLAAHEAGEEKGEKGRIPLGFIPEFRKEEER